ncbi:MAG: hypothetical protein V4729_03165 [Pseudomonadota bacterium]
MRKLLMALAISVSAVGVLTASVSAAAPAAAASTSTASIKSLQQLETTTYQTATSFFLYSVLNRDPQHLKKSQAYMAVGDGLVASIGHAGISAKWAAFRQAINSTRFTSEGMAESDSLSAINGTLTALTQAMRSQRMEQRAAANVATDKMADMLYDQHVLMQVMTTAYLHKSADYFGGAIVQSNAPQVDIDKLAAKFQGQLDQLNRHYAKNKAVAPALREVTTKWTFIRNSFINYNENNVAFIVGRYNEQINERLLLAYDKLQ